jgi:cytochrome c oxidase subunit 2
VQPTTPERRRPGSGAALGVAAVALAAGGCGSNLGLPTSATYQGDEVTSLWRILIIAALAVTLLIWVLTAMVIVSSVRRRRHAGRDGLPEQHQYRTGLEITYTAIPLVIVMAILALTFVATSRLTAVERPDLTVGVIGFQWQWQFEYRERGVQVSGGAGTLPQMWLPVGRRVRFEVSSPDVIHSFWVPSFLQKRDMIPGTVNVVEVDVKAPGQWIGRCAEYCGFDHASMKFAVCAVDGPAFDAWLAQTAARPQPVVAGVTDDGRTPVGDSPPCPAPIASDDSGFATTVPGPGGGATGGGS